MLFTQRIAEHRFWMRPVFLGSMNATKANQMEVTDWCKVSGNPADAQCLMPTNGSRICLMPTNGSRIWYWQMDHFPQVLFTINGASRQWTCWEVMTHSLPGARVRTWKSDNVTAPQFIILLGVSKDYAEICLNASRISLGNCISSCASETGHKPVKSRPARQKK